MAEPAPVLAQEDTGGGALIDTAYIQHLAHQAGFSVRAQHGEDEFVSMVTNMERVIQGVLAMDDPGPLPAADLAKYPRTGIRVPATPEESDGNAWAMLCEVRAAAPSSSLLAGRPLAVKDSIAVGGMRCLIGFEAKGEGRDWVPPYDATVVTRAMDAGAVVVGKASTNKGCLTLNSDLNSGPLVSNPHDERYSAGGSSTGCARLVAKTPGLLALGTDQAGQVLTSCRRAARRWKHALATPSGADAFCLVQVNTCARILVRHCRVRDVLLLLLPPPLLLLLTLLH